jgi:hypothetical protein
MVWLIAHYFYFFYVLTLVGFQLSRCKIVTVSLLEGIMLGGKAYA